VVLSLGVWQGVAGAVSMKGKTPIESGNDACGTETGGTPIGNVKVQRRKNKIEVDWRMVKGGPKVTYQVQLWNGDKCTEMAVLGTVKTGGDGTAAKDWKIRPSVMPTSVFTDSYNGENNDSLIVGL